MSDAKSVEVGWGAAASAGSASTSTPLWQVNTRGRKVIEMTLAELLRTYKSGKLTARSLVWSEGMPEWAPIGDVSRLMRLVRADSEPPTSGARLIGDDAEPPLAATKSYTSSGSEPPTDPGTLAIYERPLATIEFSELIEPAPESVDEPTPAFGEPAPKTSIRATLPGIAPEDLVPISASEIETASPPLPPLPPRSHTSFPAPVSASPLGAALSSAVSHRSQAAAAKPPVPGASYAVAKATQMPSTASLKLPAAVNLTGKPTAATLAAGTSKFGSATVTPTPVSTPWRSQSGSATITPAPSPKPSANDQKLAVSAVPPPMTPVKPPLSSPPRPALEFLPPIIVQEKEDDGASIIRMPLKPPVPMPMDAQFHESTLVLAGRRRPKRWVPLGATVAAVIGAACLASAVTALVVRSQPAAPRVVERRVFVTVPASEPTALAPARPAAPASTATGVATAVTSPSSAEKPNGANERAAAKSEPTKSDASPKSWRKDDPGALEASTAHHELRAGFPTNPGF